MTFSTYEPPQMEIGLTLALGLTVLSPYYRSFARSLNLTGCEQVLDYGSGSGICSRHIAARLQHGGQLTCVDISHGWQAVIRKTLRRYRNVSYHLGRIQQLHLPESAMNLVVVHYVLHDIPAVERPEIVRALAATLKPNGRLVLREPQNHGLSADEIQQLAAAAGLRCWFFEARKTFIGPVLDAIFIAEKEIS